MGPTPNWHEIQQTELFDGLSLDDLKLAWSQASWRASPRGSFLYRQGESAETMFFLEGGRVRLQEGTEDGREVLVTLIYPGEVFGALFAGPFYKATAETDTPVRAYSWTERALRELLGRVPRLQENLFELTKRFMYFYRDRYRLLATAPAERRTGWALAYLAEKAGRVEKDGIVLTGRSIQRDIADLASTTIYTVNRILGEWEQHGALTKQRGRILLLRPLRQTDFL